MNIAYNAFAYVVWFLATYYVVFILLLLIAKKKDLFHKPDKLGRTPKVSFIVPAYNEEADIQNTIDSLKQVNYSDVEFIILSDGSTDNTSSIVTKGIKGDRRFRFIDNKDNKGKASTLNQGIDLAKGEFVACMDADSMVEPGIVQKVLPYFANDKMGAVVVSVEVANKKGLNRIFDLEFIIGLSLLLKAFSFVNCIFVTPGPFSMYRRKALVEIGGFDPDNITEDLEIAYRIHKAGYSIDSCLEARVRTVLPETFKGAYIQRRRWYSGAIQTLVKHREMLFNKKYGFFGYAIPVNYVIIGMGLMLFFATSYLTISNFLESFFAMRYTGFNILNRFQVPDLDLLRMGRISFIGITGFLATIVLMVVSLLFTRHKMNDKRLGMLGYPLLFILYQVFWIGAIGAVLRGKKIKWR